MTTPMFNAPLLITGLAFFLLYGSVIILIKHLFPRYENVKADDVIDSLIRPPVPCVGMEVVDWTLIKRSNGDAYRERIIGERNKLRKDES